MPRILDDDMTWRAYAAMRARQVVAVQGRSGAAIWGMQLTLHSLTDELRDVIARGEPCRHRHPEAFAEWRDEIIDLGRARGYLRAVIRLSAADLAANGIHTTQAA